MPLNFDGNTILELFLGVVGKVGLMVFKNPGFIQFMYYKPGPLLASNFAQWHCSEEFHCSPKSICPILHHYRKRFV